MEGPGSVSFFGTINQNLPTPGKGKREKSYLGGKKGFGWLWRLLLPYFHYELFSDPS